MDNLVQFNYFLPEKEVIYTRGDGIGFIINSDDDSFEIKSEDTMTVCNTSSQAITNVINGWLEHGIKVYTFKTIKEFINFKA